MEEEMANYFNPGIGDDKPPLSLASKRSHMIIRYQLYLKISLDLNFGKFGQ